MHPTNSSRGFTLIELMIVVAIIAILAAVAIPTYQEYSIKAQVSEGMSLSASAKAAVWDFLSNTGRFPPSNGSAGLASAASIAGSYVSSVTVTDGRVEIAFQGSKVNQRIHSSVLVLSPVTYAGSIAWTCGGTGTTLEQKYLPSSCRQ
ncbi:pilin [Fulvimonas yonginensis]|uniref:Pilin n=1 Tax=Fulvimonas yonginensis TaxID=1495200 RepID=A0ABU8J9B4_9GAMM